MKDAFFLALRYLSAAPGQTAVLVVGVAVALFLPMFTVLGTEQLEDALLQRAQDTPVLIGAPGNAFDLTLSALYFSSRPRQTIPYAARRDAAHYGVAVPLHVASTVSGSPLVATDLEYLRQRSLTLAAGRTPALLGEVVAGAAVAEAFQLSPGDTLRSDLTNLYNLAGSYPLVLQITGVLAPSDTPDDDALFTDVKTTWVLDGSIHGHAEVTRDDAINPEAEEGENLEATAAVFIVSEIDDSNLSTFHLHGDQGDGALSSVLVFPTDARAHDQLLGDYALNEQYQAVLPEQVVGTILGIVLRVREGLELYFGLVAGSTVAFFGLVIVLSLRLRRAELRLMQRLGCSRATIAANLASEILILVLAALGLTSLLTWGSMTWLSSLL